jgi:dolichol-phosphate mannosyltransferase
VKLSVVIPARDERDSVEPTVAGAAMALSEAGIEYEILVIDDGSSDGTGDAVRRLAATDGRIRCHRSHYPAGFGRAVRVGLDRFEGDAVAIMMADRSEDPADLVRYHRALEQGYDCAFGSRFIAGARLEDYPRLKLVLNRIANWTIRLLFRHGYNDTTNAFKAYRREVIEAIRPLLSNHFDLTVEMPLKAAVRGYSYRIVPVSWVNRAAGEGKFALREMGSRYLFIVLYVLLERQLTSHDRRA